MTKTEFHPFFFEIPEFMYKIPELYDFSKGDFLKILCISISSKTWSVHPKNIWGIKFEHV